ncbi:endonuclease/exonuclease/phosphatase family protein [Mycobacterium sp. ACS1612]|uniref:endonuclease/exonuclease/phosphatase family protein n=1 Tax=Mycobacterium sp. ACS1612 TaxID=1834117 RepID=UPI001E376EA5|nr:endonuclease/exonuclease/phosphatase family protein [Mycobacterium sp. ACS1612]
MATAVAVLALASRNLPCLHRAVLATAALSPYLAVGAPVAAVLFGLTRNWVGVAAAGALTVASVWVRWRWYVSVKADGEVGVRVVSANLRYGRADAVGVVRLADNADILAVQELTPEKAEQIEAAGIGAVLPHRYLRAREGPAGVGIWSRYALSACRDYDEFWLGLITARVALPGLDGQATVATTHMSAPWPDPMKGWRDDLARLAEVLGEIGASAPGPVIVAGDLNATPDVREFRRLLRGGYRDAAEQAGAGLTRTHPADILLPPVFAVDHILLRGATATVVRTAAIPGSDHRALLAVVSPDDQTVMKL